MTCTLDPANHGVGVGLSGGNLTMSTTAGAGAVSTIGHDAESVDGFRFEVTIDSSDDGLMSAYIGIANALWNTSNNLVYPGHMLGADANAWGCSTNVESYNATLHNGAYGDTTELNRLDLGLYGTNIIGRTLGFLLKGGILYVISTDRTDAGGPHAGQVSAYQLFHGLTGTVFAACGSTGATTRTMGFTFNFGATPFIGTLPAWLNASTAQPWILEPPVAAFTSSPAIGLAPLTVPFFDASTGAPTSWLWDFGDGETSTEQNPTHVYENFGRYTVTLTATNGGGSTSFTVTHAVTATAGPATFPVIAWDNLLTRDDVTLTASSAAVGFDVENAADWRPWTWWKPSAAGNAYIDLTFDHAEAATCGAIYGHDLGTNGAWCQFRYSLDGGTTWLNASLPISPAGTEVIYVRWLELPTAKWRLFVSSPSVASRIASVFIGPDLTLERGCRQGFGPPEYNRTTKITNTVSQAGVWLGRSLQYLGGAVQINPDFLTEDFISDEWMPFVEHAEKYPWFLLWDESEHASSAAWCFSDGAIPGSQFTSRQYMNASIKAMTRTQ